MDNRRSYRNMLIAKGPQLRLLIPFCILLAGCFVALIYMYYQVLLIRWQLTDPVNPDAVILTRLATQISAELRTAALSSIAGLSVLCLLLWLAFSHRIFGPMISIERQVDQMIDGDYERAVTLRPRDEFKELADKLNTLAKRLKDHEKT